MPHDLSAPPSGPATAVRPPADHQAVIEREYLLIQCEKLRGWCLGFLGSSTLTPTLPAEVVRDLREHPPTRTDEQIHAALRAYSGRVKPDGPYTPAVADLAAERERLKQLFFAFLDADDPTPPPTEDEVRALQAAPPAEPLADLLDRLEAEG